MTKSMLDADDIKTLQFIASKVVVYPREAADHVWPDDPQRLLKMCAKIVFLEKQGLLCRRGDKKGYVILTKEGDKLVETRESLQKAEDEKLFD